MKSTSGNNLHGAVTEGTGARPAGESVSTVYDMYILQPNQLQTILGSVVREESADAQPAGETQGKFNSRMKQTSGNIW